MPVPNDVIFGPTGSTGQYTYADVRALSDDEQYPALQRRLETFFFAQVEPFAKADAPFPLFLLTCVGIETLGTVFFGRVPKQGEKREEIQREGFLRVCTPLHKDLSRPLSKDQKTAYDALWGNGAHKHAPTPADIVYRLGRHTMVHGYRGKGVFLTGGIKDLTLDAGSLKLNPNWFWTTLSDYSIQLWKQFYSNKENNNPMKASARLYLDELLG